jgi:predicted  nucleic acid-binding Zn-ribbon protein
LFIPVVGGAALGVGVSLALRHVRLNEALEQTIQAYRSRYPLWQSIQELEAKAGELSDTVKRLEGQQQELGHTTASLAQAQAQLEAARSQLAEFQARLLEGERQALEYERLRVHFDALSAEVQDLQQAKVAATQDLENLNRERAALEAELRRLEGEFQRVEERRLELEQLQQQLATLKDEVKEKQANRDRLEREVEALRASQAQGEANLDLALGTLKQPYFHELPAARPLNEVDEESFLTQFGTYLDGAGFVFPPRLLRAFHTALKCQDISSLVVLAGISGTGKSELPQHYARFANIEQIVVPVQPRWDSPQDLLGFYNYMERQYKPTALVRALRQYEQEAGRRGRLLMVLLDEMNLARVEYYFSDFLSKLEARRHHPESAFVELDLGNLAVPEEMRTLRLSSRVLFVGTMNEDESTQTLSDKVLDRASMLTFPRPEILRLDRGVGSGTPLDGYLTVEAFERWSQPRADAAAQQVSERIAETLQQANAILAGVDRAFGHRVSQGVTRYVLAYPGAVEAYARGDETLMWQAISDQLAQKIIPKLRGVPLEEANIEVLEQFHQEVIRRVQDELLHRAFQDAYRHNGHAVTWRGLPYEAAAATLGGVHG